jgi:hypothetical protein
LGETDGGAEDDMGEYVTVSVRRVTISMIQIPDILERIGLNYFARAMAHGIYVEEPFSRYVHI